MALINCPECGKEISDNAEKCIHCGCPIKAHAEQGKVIFQTSNDYIALLAKYIIKGESGNVIAKLKANDSLEVPIHCNTRFYIRLTGGFTSFKEVSAPAGQITTFLIGTSNGGASIYIQKR